MIIILVRFLDLEKKKKTICYLDKLRNGVETTTQDYTGNKQNDVKKTRRLHESWDHYNRCIKRDRNKGKFT